MTEVPGDQIIHFMDRSNSDVQRIGDVLAMKNPTRNITFSQDSCLFSQLNLFEGPNQIQVRRPVRLGNSFKLTLNQR
jgi:hypothetical protein